MLEPIYPGRPGQHAIMHPYPLSDKWAHGYYVVFCGPKLGIFYAYWCVTGLLHRSFHSYRLRDLLKPQLRMFVGGVFRKADTLEDAMDLWNDPEYKSIKEIIE